MIATQCIQMGPCIAIGVDADQRLNKDRGKCLMGSLSISGETFGRNVIVEPSRIPRYSRDKWLSYARRMSSSTRGQEEITRSRIIHKFDGLMFSCFCARVGVVSCFLSVIQVSVFSEQGVTARRLARAVFESSSFRGQWTEGLASIEPPSMFL